MSWTSVYNSDNDFIEVAYEGVLAAVDLKEEGEQSMALAIEHKTSRFLVDLKKFKKSLSVLDIYESPVRYDGKLKGPIYLAVVEPLSLLAREDSKFYETVCVNRGWDVRTFVERKLAIDWLAANRFAKSIKNSPNRDAEVGPD